MIFQNIRKTYELSVFRLGTISGQNVLQRPVKNRSSGLEVAIAVGAEGVVYPLVSSSMPRRFQQPDFIEPVYLNGEGRLSYCFNGTNIGSITPPIERVYMADGRVYDVTSVFTSVNKENSFGLIASRLRR